MADAFHVLFGDDAASADAAFYDQLTSLEVEENADLPGAVQLTLPITTQGASGFEDLTQVGDDHFKPYARIAVVATPDGGSPSCIFDGHVLSHKIHVDRGTTAATLRVWAGRVVPHEPEGGRQALDQERRQYRERYLQVVRLRESRS